MVIVTTRCMNTWMRSDEPISSVSVGGASTCGSLVNCFLTRWKVGKVKMIAPLGHLTERWRKHALNGDEIAPNYYEAAAFEALKGRVRSGDIAVGGSRRYRAFEGYLLPQAHFEQLAEKNQTRLAVTNEAETYLDTMQREITEKLVARKREYREDRREFTLG